MLRLSENRNQSTYDVYIKKCIPQDVAIAFLQSKGYQVKSWLWEFSDVTFPNGTTDHQVITFTACKPGEIQSEKTLIANVLKKELNQLFTIIV